MVGDDKLTIPTCQPRPTNLMGLGKRFLKYNVTGTILRKLAGTGVTHQRLVKQGAGYKRHAFFFFFWRGVTS